MQAANLSDYLNDPDLIATVFAPTNDAFTSALSQYGVTPSQALQQPSLLKGVSLCHLMHAFISRTHLSHACPC